MTPASRRPNSPSACASSEQNDAIAALDERDFEAVLAGTIEEWMFYLHPTQARVARHRANGPSRVRGGPGTGKTVVALHRARHLVRDGIAERVLLTTFVNVLPQSWSVLLERFAPAEAPSIQTHTVDSLAMGIVTAADGPVHIVGEDERARTCEALIRTRRAWTRRSAARRARPRVRDRARRPRDRVARALPSA